MKKILFLLIISTVLITISGCENKQTFEFTFDVFNGSFVTENNFDINKTETSGLTSDLLKNNIITIYTETNHTGYRDSIIITKKLSTQNLTDLVYQNLKKIKIDGYKIENEKINTIKCNDTKINTNTIDSTLEGHLDKIFFTQTFIMHKGYAYIISFSSDKEEERDNFTSNIRNINCETNN